LIEISECRNKADFQAVVDLLAEMAVWDIAETGALGIPTDDLMSLYYGDDADALMSKLSGARGKCWLARSTGRLVGCIALARIDQGTGEIQKLYLRPGARGSGLGRALMETALAEAGRRGFVTTRLVTATFMTGAIALYRAFGFVDCEQFSKGPQHLLPIMLFMKRAVPTQA